MSQPKRNYPAEPVIVGSFKYKMADSAVEAYLVKLHYHCVKTNKCIIPGYDLLGAGLSKPPGHDVWKSFLEKSA